jgi:hypothetical protein
VDVYNNDVHKNVIDVNCIFGANFSKIGKSQFSKDITILIADDFIDGEILDNKEYARERKNTEERLDRFQRVCNGIVKIGPNPLFWDTFWPFQKLYLEEK